MVDVGGPNAPADTAVGGADPKATKLSHKKWRSLLKKERRCAKRQSIAREREEQISRVEKLQADSPSYQLHVSWLEKKEELECQREEEYNRLQQALWQARERKAQEEWEQKKEWEEQEKKRKEEIERKIREEWEEQQKREAREEEARQKIVDKKKEKQDALLREATANEKQNPSWHNPLAPVNYGRERQVETCPFFLKTAVCRFGYSCSRAHPQPETSDTLLFPGMFTHFKLDLGLFDEFDTDLALEYEDSEVYVIFKEFYNDVLPEFKEVGKVIQFKVCCNYEPHLRGNVYVQYKYEKDAVAAFRKFNGRFYAGKQLSCQFVDIASWKRAICGLFSKHKCSRGKNCNFLHVFHNPGNEFWIQYRDREKFPYQNYNHSRDSVKGKSHMAAETHRYYSRHRSFSRSRTSVQRKSRRKRLRSKQKAHHHARQRRNSRDSSSSSSLSQSHRKMKRRSRSKSTYRSDSSSSDFSYYRSRKRSRAKIRGRNNSTSSYSSSGSFHSRFRKRSNNSGHRHKSSSSSASPVVRSHRKSAKHSKVRSRHRSDSGSSSSLGSRSKKSKKSRTSRLKFQQQRSNSSSSSEHQEKCNKSKNVRSSHRTYLTHS